MRRQMLWHEGISQSGGGHRQHPVVAIAAIDGLAIDAKPIEHFVSQHAEFAIDALEVRLAVEINDLDLLLSCQFVSRMERDHHLLPKERQVVKPLVSCFLGWGI